MRRKEKARPPRHRLAVLVSPHSTIFAVARRKPAGALPTKQTLTPSTFRLAVIAGRLNHFRGRRPKELLNRSVVERLFRFQRLRQAVKLRAVLREHLQGTVGGGAENSRHLLVDDLGSV